MISVYEQILRAVQQRVIDAVGSVPVRVRRRTRWVPKIDPLPVVVVAPSPQGERTDLMVFKSANKFGQSKGGIVWAYPVHVVLFAKGDREQELYQGDLDLRETIRNSLFQSPWIYGPGTEEIYDLDIETSGPFALSDVTQTYETDAFQLTYYNREARFD